MSPIGRRLTRWLSVVTWVVAARTASAEFLYSIDLENQQLVKLDVDTGLVSPVGPVGHWMIEVDLVYEGGVLYATNNDFGRRVEIVPINPQTGAALAVAAIRLTDQTLITNGEGLASVNGQLYLSFDPPAAGGDPRASKALGKLSGPYITEYFDYSLLAPEADMDALAFRAADQQLLSIDILPAGGGKVYEVDRLPVPAYRYVGDSQGITDLAFLGGRLFGLSDRLTLYELDPWTGAVLAAKPVMPAATLCGLAAPEPSSLILLALSAGLLARRSN